MVMCVLGTHDINVRQESLQESIQWQTNKRRIDFQPLAEGGSGLTAAHVHTTWTAVTNIFADVSPCWLNGGGVEQEGCSRDGVSKSHWNTALVSQKTIQNLLRA